MITEAQPAGADRSPGSAGVGRLRPADTGGGEPRGPLPGSGRILAASLVLALTLAGGYAAGRAAGPTSSAPVAAVAPPMTHVDHGPQGLQLSRDGYTLELDAPRLAAGRTGELSFRIMGPDGAAVTAFQTTHERPMHLVLVSRDLTDYQHVHPTMSADGTWRAAVRPTAGGAYRAFADFWPTGTAQAITLGVDVPVPGRYQPRPLPAEEATIVVDGYTVTLDGGLQAGAPSQVLVWLGRDGRPVNDLQPHLGAYGHLVALRHGDLAYLHVHPAPASAPSSVVAFSVQVPSPGTYRMFFEFRHRDVVRVAEFTLPAF